MPLPRPKHGRRPDPTGSRGVSRQAFAKWVQNGVPSARAEAVADLAAATDILDRKDQPELR